MSIIKRIRFELHVMFTGDEVTKLAERLNSVSEDVRATVCNIDIMKRELLIDVTNPTEDDIFMLGMLTQKTLTDLINRRYR